MPGIFINYRRDDAPGVAGRLYDYLSRSFSRRELFIDVDAIKPGLDFVKQLDSQVSQCDVMLALIGPHWTTAQDEKGRRRLDGEKDYVRIEIASALRRDIPVIPVLLDGAAMPAEEELPDDLKSLARRHALELRHTRFASDAGDIADALRASLPKRKRRWMWPAAAAACLLGLPIVWALYIWEGPAPPEPKTAAVSSAAETAPPEPASDEASPPAQPPPEPKTAAVSPAPDPAPPDPASSTSTPPDRIVLAGLGQTADLRRVGQDGWEWFEKGSTFNFKTATETNGELVIHDPSRDMYHRLNLLNGETAWRVGTTGNWTPHYRIMSMTSPAPRAQMFTDPMVGSLPLDGCLYFARECGEPAASAWCASKGLGKATSYEGFRDVPQTQTVGDNKLCTAGPSLKCGTFTAILCSGG